MLTKKACSDLQGISTSQKKKKARPICRPHHLPKSHSSCNDTYRTSELTRLQPGSDKDEVDLMSSPGIAFLGLCIVWEATRSGRALVVPIDRYGARHRHQKSENDRWEYHGLTKRSPYDHLLLSRELRFSMKEQVGQYQLWSWKLSRYWHTLHNKRTVITSQTDTWILQPQTFPRVFKSDLCNIYPILATHNMDDNGTVMPSGQIDVFFLDQKAFTVLLCTLFSIHKAIPSFGSMEGMFACIVAWIGNVIHRT
jgi:hypothetical protein